MRQNLYIRLGAVALALATLAAVTFAILNFEQRRLFETPDDGIAWLDAPQGVVAWTVAGNSPGAAAGLRSGDQLVAINGTPIKNALQVTKRLWRLGMWTQVRYRVARQGEEIETLLVTAPVERSASIENYLRIVGLLYLFIGLFIFVRRWNAPRAVHFYIFCLVSFILYSFHYSGKLDAFDLEVYWSSVVAGLLAPALLLHFSLVFPERPETSRKSLLKLAAVYLPPLVLLTIHILVALNAVGFVPTTRARVELDQLELG